MILILEKGCSEAQVSRIEQLARVAGATVRHLGDGTEDRRRALELILERGRPDPDLAARAKLWPGVEQIAGNEERHPLSRAANGAFDLATHNAALAPVPFGPETHVWIAGPCSVENPDSLGQIATAVARAGASMLRGGAFKPRTSPYAFQGAGRDGLVLLAAVARDVGLPFVSEVLDPRDVDFVAQHADMLQVGARSMQNFPLLREVGRSGCPVLLKRGMAATLDELLAAAEYVLGAGCEALVLCERGIRSFDGSRRNVLDLSIVPALRAKTALPVIVDPSHATGQRALVIPMAKAAVAAGADGVMVEVHSSPETALSDAAQALLPTDLAVLGGALRSLARLEGRHVPVGPGYTPLIEAADPVPGRRRGFDRQTR